MIICVDFDGTCVEHRYPDVGKDVPYAVTILKQVAREHKIILYTMRSGEELEDAVQWFKNHDIPLYGVNENPTQSRWTSSPKIYGQLYIDDAAAGCPLMPSTTTNRPMVNWFGLIETLEKRLEMSIKLWQ